MRKIDLLAFLEDDFSKFFKDLKCTDKMLPGRKCAKDSKYFQLSVTRCQGMELGSIKSINKVPKNKACSQQTLRSLRSTHRPRHCVFPREKIQIKEMWKARSSILYATGHAKSISYSAKTGIEQEGPLAEEVAKPHFWRAWLNDKPILPRTDVVSCCVYNKKDKTAKDMLVKYAKQAARSSEPKAK